jgi:curved DNA-binding protein CbpA
MTGDGDGAEGTGGGSGRPSLYQTLGVHPGSSREEIRRAFLRAARLHHPDKMMHRSQEGRGGAGADDGHGNRLRHDHQRFLLIQEAWEVLGDEKARRDYDASEEWQQSQCQRGQVLMAEDVDIGALIADEEEEEEEEGLLFKPCRCGERFELYRDEIVGGGPILVGCAGCSLFIRVHCTMSHGVGT